ncbi:hypothetical protein [Bradyrhizobium sp. Tv2a-2]|uniref:hypothetical protein n=1 Tax=Bradyrhizobium sp. Tv2a-2 TaxID=113395 RepID=UPI00040554BE|nr:hypothetical protein [Bradyrhizobium sp. Tv2a-2]
MIDSKQAAAALSDIDDIVRRVRQSQVYNLASLIMIWWGVLVFAGNIATWLWPWYAAYIWPAVNTGGVLGTVVISALLQIRARLRAVDGRVVAAYVLFYAFGYFCSDVLGDFGPRELGAFWPIYFMLFYVLAGLWFGQAFVALGLAITVLTLVGYFYVMGGTFLLWMAVVNGGGLVLGGLWMRWN